MKQAELNPEIPAHRLRAFIQRHLDGQCKIISCGSECICPMCDLDRVVDALRWYEDEARAISANMVAKKDMAVLASVTVMQLDAGKHSVDVLGPI